jgi:hypothetical protein
VQLYGYGFILNGKQTWKACAARRCAALWLRLQVHLKFIYPLFAKLTTHSAHFCGHIWSNVQQLGKDKRGKIFIYILKLIMLFYSTDFRETLNFSIALFEVL